MTFDMQAARDLLRAYAPGFARPCEIEALAAALDEIDRLIHLVDETVIQLGACRLVAKQIQNEQAKRIAELEGDLSDYKKVARDLVKKAMLADKQHAALKKLGQAKRARDKALIEERARRTSLVNFSPETRSTNEYRTQPDRMKDVAREQLHREGVI
ncbi:hypothetical protein M0R72_22005 [Candidatus Pacearchaeota archaeon]|jgi:hypothetical protein|nr:hypothetical protein [Candidatus Pacearchaeota archaeon]